MKKVRESGQSSGRGVSAERLRLLSVSVCGACMLLGVPGASAQSSEGGVKGSSGSNLATGVRPGGGVRAAGGVRVGMRRSVIDHTRGRLTPGAKLPRIANRIPTQRGRPPRTYEERQESFRVIRRAAAAASGAAPVTVVEANQRVLDQFAVPGVGLYLQRGGFIGDVAVGPRVVAVPDDAPRTRTEYRGMLIDGRCVNVPVEVTIDYSAPPKVDQRVKRSGPKVNERSFIGPGRIVGDEGVIVSTGPMGGWSTSSYRSSAMQQTRVHTLHAPAVAEVDPILLAGLLPEGAGGKVPADSMTVLDRLLLGSPPSLKADALAEIDSASHPDQARAIAITVILSGSVREGMEALAAVYREHPYLASRPLEIDSPELQRSMRRAQSQVMSVANREDSFFAWTAAAAFVQHVGGQQAVMKRSIERGTRVGLFGELAETSFWKSL
ncbi:MAG: hypothetical protein JJU33_09160 [Phycisphaerales bacterium]|nr:hypothetical protein [Phycisphaerales bacterium]